MLNSQRQTFSLFCLCSFYHHHLKRPTTNCLHLLRQPRCLDHFANAAPCPAPFSSIATDPVSQQRQWQQELQCQCLFPSLPFCIIYSHVYYARYSRDVRRHHRNVDVPNITLHVSVLGIQQEQEEAWGSEGCSCMEVGCGR